MALRFFRITCLLLALAVQHAVQTAVPTNQTDQSLLKAVLDQLREIKNALSEGRSSCGGGLGAVVAQMVAEQTKMYNQIASSDATMKADLQSMTLKLQKTQEKVQAVKNMGQKTQQELQAVKDMGLESGSTFVRWGRKSCPANTALVYSGVAGGKQFNETGNGNNRLCLTRSPQFDNTPVPKYYGYLYGGEYQDLPGHHNHDVPCSVCRASQSTTIMMAGTLTCPLGWTAQYTGHLTSQWKNYYAAEYVCLDGNPENDYSGGLKDDDGLLFYYVVTVCGSLPCPPYENGKVVTCVVCSK